MDDVLRFNEKSDTEDHNCTDCMCDCYQQGEDGHFVLPEAESDEESLVCSYCADVFGEIQSEGEQKNDADIIAFNEKDIWE